MTSTAPKFSLFLIFLTVVIDLLGFGIVLPLLARYGKYFGLSGWELGLLMASFSAMQFIFAPVWGRLSDRIGRRPVLLVGLAGSTLFYTLFGYASSLGPTDTLFGLGVVPWLFLTRIGAGIAGATISTAQAYIADVTPPEQRGKGMALVGAAFGIGFTFGPLLGVGLVASTPDDMAALRQPSVAARMGVATDVSTRIGVIAEEYAAKRAAIRKTGTRAELKAVRSERDAKIDALLSPEQRSAWRVATAPAALPGYVAGVLSFVAFALALVKLPESLPSNGVAPRSASMSLTALASSLARPVIGPILASIFLTTFAFAQFESTLTLLTDFLGMADRENYFVFAFVGFVLSLAQGGLVRRLLPKLGEIRMSVAGTVLMTLGLMGIAWAGGSDSRGALYSVLPVVVIGYACLAPSLQSLLSRASGAEEQGGVLGLGASAGALARILGPMLGATLYDMNPLAPYWAGAGMMAAGIVLTAALRAQKSASESNAPMHG
jgi:MFS transporter, DHA1 family, tetracycline resistance protein